jgi:hypothetical protein
MECFFRPALIFWGCPARQCIIDSSNVARLRGAGAHALIHPEMKAFAKQYGFVFRCHEVKHCDRKGPARREVFGRSRPTSCPAARSGIWRTATGGPASGPRRTWI